MTTANDNDGHLLPLVEEFYTIQGEGRNTGMAAYFIRLGGCNVRCQWCDSAATWHAGDFPLTEAEQIASHAAESGARCAVITGGEPLLHKLDILTEALHRHGLTTCIETSGTHSLSGRLDWICLSPKRHMPPLQEVFSAANELKVVVGSDIDLKWAEECAGHVAANCLLYLQPEWNRMKEAINVIVEYVKAHPQWRLSLQTHKFINIP